MIEATVLYSVTAVVVAGLAVWVALVLRAAKEPWARPAAALDAHAGHDVDADATSKATPIAKASEAARQTPEATDDPAERDKS